ncbi:MAG: twin-arginine translocase TatA/TatE family subunit [Lachnospiraceae bacterium]|nr:twin-arginine translocase TatA/TatE family subunit [Lachnospiraceae bacterium]
MLMRLGTTEILLIVLVIVLLFGPKLLPKLGQTLGDSIRGFKDGLASDDDKKEEKDGKTEA